MNKIKIVTLSLNDEIFDKIMDIFKKYNDFFNIEKDKNNYILNNDNNYIEIYQKKIKKYFKESNSDYFNKIDALIILLNIENENNVQDLKNIWLKELIKNKLDKKLPILLINYNCNNNLNKKLFLIIAEITEFFKSINYLPINENKKLVYLSINGLIKKINKIKKQN